MAQVIVHVMYPASKHFDWDYYTSTHMTMVGREMDLLHWTAAKGIDAAVPPTYQAIATLVFESREKWLQSFEKAGPNLLADIPNYTDAQPILQVTEFQDSGKKT